MLNSADEIIVSREPGLPPHLYIHVPFCSSKCDYCDFASVAGAHPDTVELVFAGIRSELTAWARAGLHGVLDSVYVGGGTPSLHADRVADLVRFVSDSFIVRDNAEVTIEANPDSVDTGRVRALREAGATRMSVGVQSFANRELSVLGRRHDASAALQACEIVTAQGLDLSVDLICGIPGQTSDSWVRSVETAIRCGAVHLSVYPLSIEDGTPLQVAVDNGLLPPVDDDVSSMYMVIAEELLAAAGFVRYEIANYAAGPENRARHNIAYWTGRQYIGVGPGAHGMVDGSVAAAIGLAHGVPPESRVRFSASPEIERWLMGDGGGVEVLSAADALREDAMLGMRLLEGITEKLAVDAGVETVLEELVDLGLVRHHGGRWSCTDRGWLLGNEVFSAIWNRE